MSVRRHDDVILLEGVCPAEDAENLLRLLSAEEQPAIDWRGCESAHAAVIQVLLVADATLQGPPKGLFLRQFVEPALKSR